MAPSGLNISPHSETGHWTGGVVVIANTCITGKNHQGATVKRHPFASTRAIPPPVISIRNSPDTDAKGVVALVSDSRGALMEEALLPSYRCPGGVKHWRNYADT